MKKIHALTIVDKSQSMFKFRNRTIEGINSSINELKKEVDKDTEIINTLLLFSSTNSFWGMRNEESLSKDFIFNRIGSNVSDLVDFTEDDYFPDGGTPLLDAIGYGIEKVKSFHGDALGNDDLKVIVTIFTDGEENSSLKYNKVEIKKMVEHFQSDGKWTFTFVGCGSLDNVTQTSSTLGIASANTVAYMATDSGNAEAYSKIGTSYSNFARSAKLGVVDTDLFTEKFKK